MKNSERKNRRGKTRQSPCTIHGKNKETMNNNGSRLKVAGGADGVLDSTFGRGEMALSPEPMTRNIYMRAATIGRRIF